MLAYKIQTASDDNGTVLVTCPDLPEVTTYAEDGPSVLSNAVSAIEEAIAARIAEGAEIPTPALKAGDSVARLPALTAVKTLLYMALKAQGMSRAELARRLGWHREQVDRLFRLDHASRLDQLEAAFDALGRTLDVRVLEAA